MRAMRGFTLIELLVVVAVIAILAAIAVPNFLEAQTRSKVSRVVADFASLRTAAEAYSVDHNRYPRMTWGGTPYNDKYSGHGRQNEPIYGTFGPSITTPVAYISQFDMLDPFTRGKDIRFDAILYTWHDQRTAQYLSAQFGNYDADSLARFDSDYGAWFMLSLGPDGRTGDAGTGFHVAYDPTNGTASTGNVIRSQRRFDK